MENALRRPGNLIIDAVILDMDGLMLDTEALYKIALQKAAIELGYVLDDELYFTFVGQPYSANEIDLIKQFGAGFPLAEFGQRWARLWREEVDARGIPLKPGLPELLDHLATRGLPVAIATSSDREYAAFSLRAAKLDAGVFAHVVTGDMVPRGKPAPDIYLEAARRLAIDPARILAIEDSDAGILSARTAGMIAIHVPDLKAPSVEAREAAFAVVESLHDVVALMESGRPASL
jgi:HAD superfamily hydrolase (TIGR01509 family)